MILFPAIDLKDGRCVRLVQGDMDQATVFNDDLQRRMRRTVWNTGGCSSWYLDDHGNNTTLWPRATFTFRRLLSRFDVEAYDVEPARSQPGTAQPSSTDQLSTTDQPSTTDQQGALA